MSRLGPYGNGDCSKGYDGTLSYRGVITKVEIDCYVNPAKLIRGIPYHHHGGSANLAIRDGQLAVLGNGHLKLLDEVTLEESRQIPTVVTAGFQGWERTNNVKARGLSGHSVPAGLSTIYWLENGLVSIRPGGDVGSRPEGHDFVRASGDAAIPELKRESNQREWLGACKGNPLVLYSLGGHAYGRAMLGSLSGYVKCPNIINNPCYISLPDRHYVIFSGEPTVPQKGAFINNCPGLRVFEVLPDKTVSLKAYDKTRGTGVFTSWDGTYHPQPWCFVNGTIYAATGPGELSRINTSTWEIGKASMINMGYAPRLAVNRDGAPVLCGNSQIARPGVWAKPVSLDWEILSTNKQFTNHLVVDNSFAYLARMLGGRLVISVFALNNGSQVNNVVVSIDGANDTGQCHDFFAHDGALYALVTPREVPVSEPRKFSQFIVRVA